MSDIPRVAEEASTVNPADGFNWSVRTHFEDSPGSEPHQILELGLKGRLHLVCQRCLQDCAVDLDEKRRFILVLTDSEADEYPLEDEVLLSLPLIPKHPDGFCEPHASTFGDGGDEEVSNERENPFNILKNMKKN